VVAHAAHCFSGAARGGGTFVRAEFVKRRGLARG
jgi:hypothetical protein